MPVERRSPRGGHDTAHRIRSRLSHKRLRESSGNCPSGKICAVSKPHHRAETVRGGDPHEVKTGSGRLEIGCEDWRAIHCLQLGTNVYTEELQALHIHLVASCRNNVISLELLLRPILTPKKELNLATCTLCTLDS